MKRNSSIPVDAVVELAELTETKRSLDVELKKVAAKISSVEEALLKDFSEGEVKKITVAITGGAQRTVYLRRQVWASAKDGDTVKLVEFLRANDLKELTTYSPQKLTSYVREHDDGGRELDKELAALVNVSEVFKLVVIKA